MTLYTEQKLWPFVVITEIVVYIAIDILLAFLRPHYSILHNAESDYGRGPYFWVMDFNFLLRCGLSLALVKAIWNVFPKNTSIKKATYWLITWAISTGLLAFFTDNPYGYSHLRSGGVHILLAFIAFISVIVGMVLLNTQFRTIKTWNDITPLLMSITILAIISIILLGHAGIRPHRLGGLYERIFLGSILVWEAVISLKMLATNKLS